MGFSVFSTSLTSAISEALREIRSELFRGPVPHRLHHYTRAATVESVVQGRALWATCIAEQLDQTEISHTSDIVTQFAEKLLSPEANAFSDNVLRRLPFFMEERKRWVFIACFCDDQDSALHWNKYGDYRLTFPAPCTTAPSLSPIDFQAEYWCQQVLYDERLQRDAIERALRAIVLAISENTNGRNEGPWAKAIADNCARNAAQLLLGLAVAFKQSSFSGEREWRVVCAPHLGSNNSAPTWIDDNFSLNIKRSPRSHVLLQVQRDKGSFQPLLVPAVPFLHWSWNPNRYNAQEVDRINDLLAANDRADLLRYP